MQDKDFDRLLKERLEAFEVQPSASSWSKITADLDQKPKKKKALPIYWTAAASVLLLASAVLWLYNPAVVVKLHPVAGVSKGVKEPIQPRENDPLSEDAANAGSFSAATNSSVPAAKPGVFIASKSHRAQFKRPSPEIPVQPENKERVDTKDLIAKKEVVVPAEILKPLAIADDTKSQLANASSENAEESPEQESRHKIRSIGGLVNFVVAQVDKRENKIIEFKDGEEGSEVSGINLGPLKFKSRNK